MGVIDLYSKIKSITGSTWDGTPISRIVEMRPQPIITEQPSDTSGVEIPVRVNTYGYYWQLQRKDGDNWVSATGGTQQLGTRSIIPLTSISSTSRCRVRINVYGVSVDTPLYTNEFTVTRTAAQTQAMKMDAQAITEDITVEKEDITPVEKPTTTKSK